MIENERRFALPYRPCVGIMVLNRNKRVWIGRRIDAPKDAEGAGSWWQMPQGGIDEGEDAREAALRELYEETSIHSVEVIGEIEDWLTYDLPENLVGFAWNGRYRGQKQKWFAARFMGNDSEINIEAPGGGVHKPEFDEWRWVEMDEVPNLIVPFKRKVYDQVVGAFSALVH
ncbi:MAG: RNA pyrophosphohydrolase [Hyphomicrobiales bacterium]|nr:RNA pyrophosphohydrolase [Hyphomicrobiales bacterium]